MEDRLSRTWLDELLVSGGGGGAGEVAAFVLSFGDFVRVLPRLLAASPGADLGWHGPAAGDDRFGLGRGERVAVGVADDVRGAAPHDGPGPFGEAGGGYAQGAEVVFAAFGHLLVVDAGELGGLAGGRCQRRGQGWCAAGRTRPWTWAGPLG